MSVPKKTPATPSPARVDEHELLEWRKEFPILQETTYLLSHSLGAMPRGAADWLRRYTDEWGKYGIDGYERWMPRLRQTADLVGSLFGAPKGTVVMHQNVSTLISIIISAIMHPRGRKKIVTTDLNFPSIHYNWKLHEELGLKVHVVKSPDGIHVPTELMTKAIDDKTLAVMVDHGIFRSGYLQDVGTIARAARKKGAMTIVDAYQTVGCVPIDVVDWGVEFLVGGSHKWLCGGPGASFLYVRKDLIPKLTPRVTGWFSHKRPFAFEMDMDFASDAMRFATGTPNMPGVHAARAGIEIISQVGPSRVRAKNVRLMQKLIDQARARGFRINSPLDPHRRSGVVCIDFPGADVAERQLLQSGFQVDYRPRCGIRLSAHFYTTEEELLSVLPELEKHRRKA